MLNRRKTTKSDPMSQSSMSSSTRKPTNKLGSWVENPESAEIISTRMQQSIYQHPLTRKCIGAGMIVYMLVLLMEPTNKGTLDFVVAGFPKSGTTSLLFAFHDHPETQIAQREKCMSNMFVPPLGMYGLDYEVSELNTMDTTVKRGIKCPEVVLTEGTIGRVNSHSPHAKFLVGMRHPILLLESFYNYRISEHYKWKKWGSIPTLESLVQNGRSWRWVSLNICKYELYLKNFLPTILHPRSYFQQRVLDNNQAASATSTTTHPRILLYTLEQMQDEDETRLADFRKAVQTFLGLTQEIPPLIHQNRNDFKGKMAYDETIDICDANWDDLRNQMLQTAQHTVSYIVEFINDPGVTVANRQHFLDSLLQWTIDPCIERRAKGVSFKKTT